MNKTKSTENKYLRGKIYKIISYQTNEIYIGSTCEPYLCNRLAGHKRDYKSYKNNKHNYITSFKLIAYEDVQIVLIEDYPCDRKEQLLQRESYWIQLLDCVNKIIPGRTPQQYRLDNIDKIKQQDKQYKLDHKDKIKQYRLDHRNENKQYRLDNIDKLKQQKKQYRLDNKDKIKQSNKQYRLYQKKLKLINKHQQIIDNNQQLLTAITI